MNFEFTTTLALAGILTAATLTPALAGECSYSASKATVENVQYGAAKAEGNIVQVAVEAGQFKTLASLLTSAGLVETLQGDGPFTVFAPTDEAFKKVPAPVLEALGNDPDLLKRVLLYHVAAGKMEAGAVVAAKEIKTVEGSKAAIVVTDAGATIDGAKIIKTDVAASNGVIHVIDSVILPADIDAVAAKLTAGDIVEVAVRAGDFKTLANLLTQAELVETLKGEGPFTVFAPTDAAFAKIPAETVNALLADKDALRNVLLYHVVAGELKAADVVGAKEVKTVQGSSAAISMVDGKAMIDGATITATDVVAKNGVIHVIDTVILPKN